MSLRVLNPNAEVLNKSVALHMNINAAKGLQDVHKTNLSAQGNHQDVTFRSLLFPLLPQLALWALSLDHPLVDSLGVFYYWG